MAIRKHRTPPEVMETLRQIAKEQGIDPSVRDEREFYARNARGRDEAAAMPPNDEAFHADMETSQERLKAA